MQLPAKLYSRRRSLGQLAAWLAATAATTATAQSAPSSALALGQTIAWPSLTLLGGQALAASHFEGRVTVLYWWASWCPFCREQTPEMQKLWVRHGPQGLRMLGISVDSKADAAQQHWSRNGFTFPTVLSNDELARAFSRPRGVPVTAVIDRRGLVAQIERGQMFPEDIAALAKWL
ncbi:MAG: TlpA family protein disulfide reductase [Betaproteobacteria bacterium]|nr:TlpA family protein disulfide reductase [Betaproteobacteria bacterium]